jgi:large subunit ribosomal protein L21
MYAIIETGGKQLRVRAGDVVQVERLPAAPGEPVVFERVLAVGEGSDLRVGSPYVPGARVVGRLLAQEKAPKVVVFKYRAKVNYRRKQGHRQLLSRVRIEQIEA